MKHTFLCLLFAINSLSLFSASTPLAYFEDASIDVLVKGDKWYDPARFSVEPNILSNPNKSGLNTSDNCFLAITTSNGWWGNFGELKLKTPITITNENRYLKFLAYRTVQSYNFRVAVNGNHEAEVYQGKLTKNGVWESVVVDLGAKLIGQQLTSIVFVYSCNWSNGTSETAVDAFDSFELSDNAIPIGKSLDKSYIEALGGKIIAHSPKSTGIYLGSPAITILPNGDYLASLNHFGADTQAISYLYRSTDKGLTWSFDQSLDNFTYMNLFVHNGVLYSIGYSGGTGKMLIRKSIDNGQNWTVPTNSQNGILLNDVLYCNAPQNVVVHNGRIWYALNDVASAPSGWGKDKIFMMSAPENADLLDASSWTRTNYLQGVWQYNGWLEPGVVAAPDGGVYIMPRVDYRDVPEKSALVKVNSDLTTLSFNPETGYFDFPGGCKKFTVKYDDVSGKYWTLSNYIPPYFEGGNVERSRNTLALSCSDNLTHWTIKGLVLQGSDISYEGFQYVDWLFDGADIILASRTSFNDGLGGGDNSHNSNFLTFHRVVDFRNYSSYLTEIPDPTPKGIENFEKKAEANYSSILQVSNGSSTFSLDVNPLKDVINQTDSVYRIVRNKNDYWEAGIILFLRNPVPVDKKFLHVLINWKDAPTSFAARFYGSDKDNEYIANIPATDKIDFAANAVQNKQTDKWFDLVIPLGSYTGTDIKYIMLIPDRQKEIGTEADTYTYYIDEIVLNNEVLPRGYVMPEQCAYYGCTEPNPNEWTVVKSVGVSEIRLYPNPVKDMLYMQGTDGKVNIEIFSLNGIKVMEAKVVSSINISNLEAGVYCVHVDEKDIFKIVKK